jgi:hypothetical protein
MDMGEGTMSDDPAEIEACDLCRGAARCPQCNGIDGACDLCDGTGICPECQGRGYNERAPGGNLRCR